MNVFFRINCDQQLYMAANHGEAKCLRELIFNFPGKCQEVSWLLQYSAIMTIQGRS